MHLVKWFRKNNTKIMAVVVIVLMVGFVGGSSLSYLLQGSGGARDKVAHYGRKQAITRGDVWMARQELEVLQALRADQVLQSQDLRGILLSELLFSQSRSAPALFQRVQQTIRQYQYRVSDKQLMAIYDRTVLPAIYWILLRDEARAAGISVRADDVGNLLGQVIPRLFDGQSYPLVMQSLVARYGSTEGQILAAFGQLLSVLQYAQTVCSTESFTNSQIRHTASLQNETVDAEFVQIEAGAFADKESEPAPEAVLAQFNTYKAYLPGDIGASNPYGYGYKLPPRVQLDYLVVKLDEVASMVPSPTDEEAEQFYQQNRQALFSEQVQVDPNDPNSVEDRVKSYVEVFDSIMDQLTLRKITTKAEQVLQEAKNLSDAGLPSVSEAGEGPSLETLRNEAGDYGDIARRLSEQYGVTVYSGQTGLLNAIDMQTDEHLGRLVLGGYGAGPVRLGQVVFSVEALGDDATILMFGPRTRRYTTIGPARDLMTRPGSDLSGQIMAMVRVVRAEPAAEPTDPNVTYSLKTFDLGDTPEEPNDSTYSVREKVVEDLRKIAAWDTAKGKAEELVAMASKDGWDAALAEFNKLYGRQATTDPNDPNAFEVQPMMGLQRISGDQLQTVAAQTANSPAAMMILREARIEKQFVERLYTLIPTDPNAKPQLPQVMTFEPKQSFYCLKDLSVRRLNQEDYRRMKGMLLRRVDHTQSQSLAVVHFNPANILKRLNFRWVEEAQEPDPQAEVETEQEAKGNRQNGRSHRCLAAIPQF